MSNPAFDKKFGADALDAIPHSPGVYRYVSKSGALVYVGKAKDLRARLAQYRNANRTKAHRKMRRIVRESASLTFEVTASEGDALLLENELIRTHRPPLNVEGAFSFLYPVIGLKRTERHLHLVLSTHPDLLSQRDFRLVGCYRNRTMTRAGFEALIRVMEWLGHRERAPERLPYTTWRRFRQVSDELDEPLFELLAGRSDAFLALAVVALIEKPAARRESAEVQKTLKLAKRFFESEARRLSRLTEQTGENFISQSARDAADIRAGFSIDVEC